MNLSCVWVVICIVSTHKYTVKMAQKGEKYSVSEAFSAASCDLYCILVRPQYTDSSLRCNLYL